MSHDRVDCQQYTEPNISKSENMESWTLFKAPDDDNRRGNISLQKHHRTKKSLD